MHVSDLMSSRPVSIPADAGIEKALLLMDAHEIRHLVVVEGNVTLGVVSDRDLLQATGWHAPASTPRAQANRESVRDVMHAPAVTVTPRTSVIEAAGHFVVEHIGCLPVLDADRLVGIVTERDLLAACAARHDEGVEDPPVSELMSSAPMVARPDESLDTVSERIRSAGVRHLPVLDAGRLVGVVSDRDLRRAHGLGRHRETPVQEFMTREVISIAPSHGVREAVRCMDELVISCVPVLEDGQLVGILSMEDLVYHCMLELSSADAGR